MEDGTLIIIDIWIMLYLILNRNLRRSMILRFDIPGRLFEYKYNIWYKTATHVVLSIIFLIMLFHATFTMNKDLLIHVNWFFEEISTHLFNSSTIWSGLKMPFIISYSKFQFFDSFTKILPLYFDWLIDQHFPLEQRILMCIYVK